MSQTRNNQTPGERTATGPSAPRSLAARRITIDTALPKYVVPFDVAEEIELELNDVKTWRYLPTVPASAFDVLAVTSSGRLIVARYYGGMAYKHWRDDFGEVDEDILRWLPIPEND